MTQALTVKALKGISGWKGSRQGFQTMIADAAAGEGKFEVILCWDQDRFSRFEPTEFFHYCYLLNQAGVRIETVAQGRLDLANMGWITRAGILCSLLREVRKLMPSEGLPKN